MDSASPSPQALRAFAAAARRQSFRDAAAELGVTPSAVSHQIKALEAWIGAPLFERGVRQVRLTPTGARLSAALNGAFAKIDAALAQAKRAAALSTLKISTLPLFTSAWLTPRLADFEARHPDVSFHIEADARVVDLIAGEADVAIRNVGAPTPGVYVRKLLDLRAVPLCTPALAQEFSKPKDLARATLINLSVGRAGWTQWLERAGAAGLTPKRTLTFNTIPAAVDAAAQGRGVMLGLMPLIWDWPAASMLVPPFPTPPQDAGAYFIACRKEDRTGLAGAFMDWLSAEMRTDLRRLKRIERARLGAS